MDQFHPRPANSSPLTPLSFLDRCATVYGDCPSVVYGNTIYTWTETRQRCLRVASSISKLGIKRQEVVSVIAPNVPAMYELYFAIPFAGAVINSINTRLDARTVSVILAHSESKLVFVDYDSVSVVRNALSMFPPNKPKPLLVLVIDEGVKIQDSTGFECTYESMLENGDPNFNWIRPVSEWDPITLNYTSGTTSSPKGVVHCHRGMFAIAVDSLIEWSVPKQPVYLWTLPMFHANGWSYTWGMAAVGATNICLRKFDTTIIYDLIDKHGVTHMCGAPVVLNMLSNAPDVKPLKNPVNIMTAGAPPPAPVLARAESIGFVISHGYGLTETGGLVVTCAWKRKWDRFPATERARLKSRQGVRTVVFTDMDVVDPESGVSVTRDGLTLGEVVLRGGCVMLGYFKDPEETAKSMRENGWFYTGDVAVMHPDGYLEIKDRSKDVIISGGENLSSVEVESVLYTHPAVNEAAVVARADEFWGETPCAFVSLKAEMAGKVTEKEVVDYCKGKLPGYMVPKTVVFKEELPKTSTGKIQKFVLREMAKKMGTIRKSRM
ncbi:putative AMP-dependent synthetase/ligase, AMP-binding, AMP-binding enzyme domain-containing protein [Helianthus annuus]|uniref:AMP-dependent synthetase/ligase, AMP-binding enzyme domain-containing protein n=1 Tax=Helianthus annuus TaxID=4232 RepID=A0A251SID5_HELAN|nr:probable acyl-activating enzyme 5, peroxisomal [Helianthus annuus]KAF5769200.1 putative AMP-dependent synthetase/ligase, AMP-binding enzyme domain-containing protein [Helianthus annuus]KAJ0485849.1 putative AMP-dependent synthetase/ligase, AMP-binding, AMP-binding enzyme domain, ANL [Helianthus annuus]KAJ0656402.1 putative AMP-dependent synthetase/ligase, AMP-binding, AMP-binding enzyme domain, ANL [Helianthus annuus]KAJ0660032.1 putative AMP-dependent synthetase/ligase, AMP-binding, AMP-bin